MADMTDDEEALDEALGKAEEEDVDVEMAKGLEKIARDLKEQTDESLDRGYDTTEDFSAALSDGPRPVLISTGKTNEDGMPVKLKVLLQDPGSEAVIVAYLAGMAKSREKPELADLVTRSLWRAVVSAPKEIAQPENYKKLTSAFRNNLTFAVLSHLGVDGDFLARVGAMNTPQERRMAKRLSTQSPKPTDEDRKRSEDGPKGTSSSPTGTSSDEGSKSVSTPSSTSDGPSPRPSEAPSRERSGSPSPTPSSARPGFRRARKAPIP